MAIDVLQTLEGLGVEGYTRGDEFIGHCPQHEKRTGFPDSNPSWSINIDTGLFNCFSCGYRGSIITLIVDMRGVSIDVAKGIVIKPDLATSVSKIPARQIAVAKKTTLSESELAVFKHPPAWACRRRGISRAACDVYEVKWDYINDRWIMPIRKPTGELVGWQVKAEMNRFFRNFPLGVKKADCLFGYQAFESGRMIVVESPLDCVKIRTNGVVGGVSTYGAEVSRAQILLMTVADEVVFALDNYATDDAGKVSSQSLLRETHGLLKSVRFFNYGGITAKDPGEMTPQQVDTGIELARSRAYWERALGDG